MRLSPWNNLGRWMGFLALALCLGAVGCGSSTGTITGKVYYKNTPLKGGTVNFLTSDKKVNQLSEIQEDGSYKIEKMPVGEVTITVETISLRPARNIPTYAPPKGQETSGGYTPPNIADKAKRYVPIPDKYASADNSGLKYTVKGGSQPYDIKLE
jgi:hypothetical protein